MAKTITLPVSGAQVVLRDVNSVKQGDRRKVMETMRADDSTVGETLRVSYALIGLMVESWSLDLLPPSVRAESLDDLDIPDYDALQDEAVVFMGVLFPNLKKTVESEQDPKADTDNFND